jgi:hypothetical protein
MQQKTTKQELAESAFWVLNDLMGEIHGARIPGYIATKKPEILIDTRYIPWTMRVLMGSILISLRKFDDIWNAQITTILLPNDIPAEGLELSSEIRKRKLRKFCNLAIAHYAETKIDPKTPIVKIEKMIADMGFNSDEEFFSGLRISLQK